MGTEDDATRDALARDLWLAEGYDLDADPEGSTAREMRPIYAARADHLLAAGYLPPDQADALRAERDEWKARSESWDEVDRQSHANLLAERDEARAERDQAKARAEQQASAVERLCVEWDEVSDYEGSPAQRTLWEATDDLRAVLATPSAANAHDQP